MESVCVNEAIDVGWLERVEEQVPAWLERVRVAEQPGRYLPCARGATRVGREMALGFSCFAMKLQHMLGCWESLAAPQRAGWLRFIEGFQRLEDGAFIDPPEVDYLSRVSWREQFWRLLGRGRPAGFAQSIILAETKQAIATLAEVGATPRVPFRDFPMSPAAARAWLEALNWSRPWGAGGEAAKLVVFIKTQAPALVGEAATRELLGVCRDFYDALADPETGAYFRSSRPAHGELINGAMKVLMALDWLEAAPRFPERLVATCLAQPPAATGCHLVDAIYVLHQTLRGGASESVRRYCGDVMRLIQRHANDDGGFSFYVRKAQTNYYGVRISRGLPESDIQGTCLLVWALAMLWRLLAPESARWTPMRP